jgi:DNA-binding transcriptional LysR family regulator
MNRLRLLGFDDLFLLRLLLEGSTITSTARQLALTQPAVSQRMRKIEGIFRCRLTSRTGRRVRLTDEGRALCNRAAAALALMTGVAEEPAARVINLGTRPEAGMSWLWPALSSLRRRQPHLVFHCHFGSGEEILRLLAAGTLDAVLTSAPHTVRGYGAVDVALERYVLIAAPHVAESVRHVDDLKQHVLIEHDRSFPFLRYVDAAQRAGLRYRDVWFVGSTVTMTAAVVAGHGVGIIPEYLARRALASGKLSRILPAIRIDQDHFRLVHRLDPAIDEPVTLLAAALRKVGLR